MAANYWESTQRRHWQFTRQELEDLRKKLEDEDQNLVQMYPLPHVRHLSIFINQRKTFLDWMVSRAFVSISANPCVRRNCPTRETTWCETAGDGNRPIVHSSILYKG